MQSENDQIVSWFGGHLEPEFVDYMTPDFKKFSKLKIKLSKSNFLKNQTKIHISS